MKSRIEKLKLKLGPTLLTQKVAVEPHSALWVTTSMGKRRYLLRNWPIEVYDYDEKAITDEAVGGIDLRRGCWIHCKWCNVTLKTIHYSLVSWKNHMMSMTHMDRNQKYEGRKSLPQVTSCSSQSLHPNQGGELQPQFTSCSSPYSHHIQTNEGGESQPQVTSCSSQTLHRNQGGELPPKFTTYLSQYSHHIQTNEGGDPQPQVTSCSSQSLHRNQDGELQPQLTSSSSQSSHRIQTNEGGEPQPQVTSCSPQSLHRNQGRELQPQFTSCSSQSSHHIQTDEGGESQPQVTSCSSQSSHHSSHSSIKDAEKISMQAQDYESLVFVRRDLHRSKQHQARHERDVSNVINAMTSLITDQQSDIKTLLDKVRDMKNEIQGLKHDLNFIRQRERQRMQAPRKRTATAISYTAQRPSPSHVLSRNTPGFRISRMTPTCNRVTKKRRRMSEMDIFEQRFRLTERG